MNACPLRRIAQSFVIATKTKLDLTGLQVPGHIDDDYLKRKGSKLADKSKGGIFAEGQVSIKFFIYLV